MLHQNALSGSARRPVASWRRAGQACQPCQLATQAALRGLYEASSIAPLRSGYLRVSDLHNLYYEVHGSPNGTPAVVVHGGPGAGCYVNHTRFFDVKNYQVVLIDQRGCGRSTPRGCLAENSTGALVSDLDAVRQHLGIEKWILFGGSWGVTLSMAYATTHPHRVAAIILRGVCMMRQQEIDWMYGGGAGALKPWAWQGFLEHLDPEERRTPLIGYYKRLLSPDTTVRDAAASSWMQWEMSVGFDSRNQLLDWDGTRWSYQTFPTPFETRSLPKGAQPSSLPAQAGRGQEPRPQRLPRPARATVDTPQAPTSSAEPPSEGERIRALFEKGMSYRGDARMSTSTAQALLECHYSVNGAFLCGTSVNAAGLTARHPRHEMPLLERVGKVRHIPGIAVHGQLDLVCPPMTAFELHKAWPELQLRVVPGAGHSMYDPAIAHELVEATTIMRDVVERDAVEKAATPHLAVGSGHARKAVGS